MTSSGTIRSSDGGGVLTELLGIVKLFLTKGSVEPAPAGESPRIVARGPAKSDRLGFGALAARIGHLGLDPAASGRSATTVPTAAASRGAEARFALLFTILHLIGR